MPLGMSIGERTARCGILSLASRAREGENAEQIVSQHIKLLHRYNEAKDATQVRRVVS